MPGFRATFLTVCVLYVLLAGLLFAQGIRPTMAQFGVPAEVLGSPHYADTLLWVYSHQIVIGLILGVIGLFAESARLKLWIARLMLGAQLYYLYLDVRSSDSVLGDALYKGPSSVVPALIGLLFVILFAHVVFCGQARAASADASRANS